MYIVTDSLLIKCPTTDIQFMFSIFVYSHVRSLQPKYIQQEYQIIQELSLLHLAYCIRHQAFSELSCKKDIYWLNPSITVHQMKITFILIYN